MTRRPWTAEDQITAEVAAACGVSCSEIGRLLCRKSHLVSYHLDSAAANKERERRRRYYKANADKMRECSRRYREANRDSRLQYLRRYYKANADKMRECSRRYREANADRLRESKRRYNIANVEKVRERCRRYRKANADKVIDYQRRYRVANRDKRSEHSRRRNAWKRAAQLRALLPATPYQVKARFALWQNRCAFCGVDAKHPRNHGDKRLTEEHALALKNQGIDESDNIMPACRACNSSKQHTPLETWYCRQPFFTKARWQKIQRHCPAAVAGQLPLAFTPPDAEPA